MLRIERGRKSENRQVQTRPILRNVYLYFKAQIRVALFTQDGGRGHVLRMPRLLSLVCFI